MAGAFCAPPEAAAGCVVFVGATVVVCDGCGAGVADRVLWAAVQLAHIRINVKVRRREVMKFLPTQSLSFRDARIAMLLPKVWNLSGAAAIRGMP